VEQVGREVVFPRMRKVKMTLKTIDRDLATAEMDRTGTERQRGRGRETERGRQRDREAEGERQRETERGRQRVSE
jgi:hypothetical protein